MRKQTLPELPSVISRKGWRGLNQPRMPGGPLPLCPVAGLFLQDLLVALSTHAQNTCRKLLTLTDTQNGQTSREDMPRSAVRETRGEPLAGLAQSLRQRNEE